MCKVVHFRRKPFDIYIGRPSKWGNPFSHEPATKAKFRVGSRKEAVEAYKDWILNGDGSHLLMDLHELEGKTLGCWCSPKACHGDVLVELVSKYCK